mmetsp:Transcript_15978/g.26326  ORF Transcript_15978/g.26326 Transcript_15978/m.26326 type:complete len:227 (-) Transcript_15978:95-775(-)
MALFFACWMTGSTSSFKLVTRLTTATVPASVAFGPSAAVPSLAFPILVPVSVLSTVTAVIPSIHTVASAVSGSLGAALGRGGSSFPGRTTVITTPTSTLQARGPFSPSTTSSFVLDIDVISFTRRAASGVSSVLRRSVPISSATSISRTASLVSYLGIRFSRRSVSCMRTLGLLCLWFWFCRLLCCLGGISVRLLRRFGGRLQHNLFGALRIRILVQQIEWIRREY